MKRIACLAWLLAAMSQLAFAQPANIALATRLVKVFSDLEAQLADAAGKREDAGLAKLLDASFEMRTAAAPGRPTPRAQWIAGASRAPLQIEQMAVQDLNETAIVSYLERSDKPATFVVDVWSRQSGGWLLRVRYAAPAP